MNTHCHKSMADDEISTNPSESTSQPPPLPPLLIPDIPDDIAIQCIARVPRSQHPSLSLVSKSWRSTVRSQPLFATRSHLNYTESSLYLNIRIKSHFAWYLFHPKTIPKLAPSPLPPIPSQPIGSAFAVLGPKFYVIGGSINDIPSDNVWVFDCRINGWEVGPKMRAGREFATVETVEGKIYVKGGRVVDNWARSMNCAEVFDPVTQVWTTVASPIEVKEKWMHSSPVLGRNIYEMTNLGGAVYDVLRVGGCRSLGVSVCKGRDLGYRGRAAMVGGIWYSCNLFGKIRGYDVERDVWTELRGVEKALPPKFLCGATLMNLDGRLCVVWEQKLGGKEMEIMCAEIEVSRDDSDGGAGLSGSVLWSAGILWVPIESAIVHCLAVAL